MNRITLPILALTLLALTLTASSTPAQTAPATPEELAAMKTRLSQLKTEAAALQAKIDAAEAPAAGTEPALITALNTLPKNLWPGDNDTETKQTLREKWLTDNIKVGTPYTFTGIVSVVSPTTINPPGKPSIDGIYLVLDCGKHMVWGKEKSLRVITDVDNVSPADTLDWGDKKTITITGNNKDCRPNSNPVEIRLDTSKKN